MQLFNIGIKLYKYSKYTHIFLSFFFLSPYNIIYYDITFKHILLLVSDYAIALLSEKAMREIAILR